MAFPRRFPPQRLKRYSCPRWRPAQSPSGPLAQWPSPCWTSWLSPKRRPLPRPAVRTGFWQCPPSCRSRPPASVRSCPRSRPCLPPALPGCRSRSPACPPQIPPGSRRLSGRPKLPETPVPPGSFLGSAPLQRPPRCWPPPGPPRRICPAFRLLRCWRRP